MPLIDVTQSMLLVIDAQQDFYGAERADVDRAGFDATLRRAAWVTAVAGRLGVPVVVTEEDAAVNGPTAEAIREALPTGAPVLPKWTFGAPGNPGLSGSGHPARRDAEPDHPDRPRADRRRAQRPGAEGDRRKRVTAVTRAGHDAVGARPHKWELPSPYCGGNRRR